MDCLQAVGIGSFSGTTAAASAAAIRFLHFPLTIFVASSVTDFIFELTCVILLYARIKKPNNGHFAYFFACIVPYAVISLFFQKIKLLYADVVF